MSKPDHTDAEFRPFRIDVPQARAGAKGALSRRAGSTASR